MADQVTPTAPSFGATSPSKVAYPSNTAAATKEEPVQVEAQVINTTLIEEGSNMNKYQWFIDLAVAIDAWRIFPRVFITTYIVILYQSVHWFMDLANPNNAQAGLISVVVGSGAAWFGLYTQSKPKMQDKK